MSIIGERFISDKTFWAKIKVRDIFIFLGLGTDIDQSKYQNIGNVSICPVIEACLS